MIYKIKNYGEGKFTQIANEVVRDKKLTLLAKGLLLFMLSFKEDKEFSFEFLIEATNTRQQKLTTALDCLKEEGYVKIIRERTTEGKFGKTEWFVSEVPNLRDDEPFGS